MTAKFEMDNGPVDEDIHITLANNIDSGRVYVTKVDNLGYKYYIHPKNRKQRKHNMLGYCHSCKRICRKYRTPDGFIERGNHIELRSICRHCIQAAMLKEIREEVEKYL